MKFIPINQSVISLVYPAACKFLISTSSFKLFIPRVISSGVHSLTKILFTGFLFLANKNIKKEISSPSLSLSVAFIIYSMSSLCIRFLTISNCFFLELSTLNLNLS